ncbi:MAG: glycosyltransferase family 4 protein [Solirubrobacteraceae bacterium]
MRVLFVVDGGLDDPSARARVHQFVPGLSELGVDVRILSASDRAGLDGKRRVLRAARQADVVVLHRILPPRPLLGTLVHVNPVLVFDFDDALHTLPGRRRRLRPVLELAAEVVAGNQELARYARRFCRSVTVVPTVVDPGAYSLSAGFSTRKPVRVGWIGTPGNLPFLELVRPALRELVKRGRSLDVRLISSSFPDWPELPVTPVPWKFTGAASALAELDIGLAPLPDTPWTRGKCGLKVIEYMATGLPVVAAPVGALREIVVDGKTGLLARNGREWVAHVDRLVVDAELRCSLGQAGRRRVEERYSVAVAVPAIAKVLERAATTVRRSAA